MSDENGDAAGAGRDRRDPGARRAGHARLLAQPARRPPRRCATAGSGPATSARSTQDGFLTLKDRSKDVIISGGIEHLSARGRGGAAAASGAARSLGGRTPEPRNGARTWSPSWCRSPAPALDPADLDRLCLEHIARFKRPKSYFVEAELPKNNYGKVLKTELRARLAGKSAGSPPPCGEGFGVGVDIGGQASCNNDYPLPSPPPQGGREQAEFAARAEVISPNARRRHPGYPHPAA